MTPEPLSPTSAAVLLVDHQTRVFEQLVTAPPRAQVKANVPWLARAATGRRQLITAGIGTDVCGVAPALHAHRDGHQVAFVADACGSATELAHDISLRRLEQQGIQLMTTASVISELSGDYRTFGQTMGG